MTPLESFDFSLFRLINQSWTNEFFNAFFPVISNGHKLEGISWWLIPLATLTWTWFGKSRAVACLCAILLTGAICDTFAYQVIKPIHKRARPHHRPEIGAIVRVPYGPKSGSFPSNHATTTMGVATVLSYYYPPLMPAFVMASLLVGYSRVYVGVHFPSDVVGGWIIGALVGIFMINIVFKRVRFFQRPSIEL